MLAFYTIGHSTRTVEEFIHLLRAADVSCLVDIRSIPRSRTNPQYNQDVLPATLATFEITYAHISQLGGRRNKSKTIANDTNGFWQNRSFQNYADYALTPDFQAGLDELILLGRTKRCAIMCSEVVWWRCHRRIVADHLLARGEKVFHLMNEDKIELATFTKGARVQNGVVIYPADGFLD